MLPSGNSENALDNYPTHISLDNYHTQICFLYPQVRVRGVARNDLFHPWAWNRGLLAEFSSSSSSSASCSSGLVPVGIKDMRPGPGGREPPRKINLRGYYSRISHSRQNSISLRLLTSNGDIGGCWPALETAPMQRSQWVGAGHPSKL